MKLDILKSLNAERDARRAAVVVTDQASGEQRLVKAADVAKDPLKDLIEKHIRSGKSGMEETPQGKFFLTVHVPAPRIVVTGAVHISQALAPIAKLLGYDVTIVDPRTAFASQERFPDVKVIAEWPDVALPPLGVDRYTAFVALTHDPKIDDPALTHALQRDCFYIGALGSRKTHGRRLDRLKEQGLFRRRCRAHPRSDRAADRRGVAGRDRCRDHGRDHRPPAPGAAEGRGENPGDGIVKFGAVPIAEAEGGVAVHSIRKASLVLKKGTVIGRTEIAALQAAGIPDIVVARLEPGDVSEDVAAGDIAKAVAGEGVRLDRAFTGRANLFSDVPGVLVVNKPAIDALNLIDEAVTFATLPAFKPVVAGEMIATVKIIPFAVAGALRDAAVSVARAAAPLVKVAPYRIRKVGVISTMLPGLAAKVIDKTMRVTAERLAPAGATIVAERRIPHDKDALVKALEEVLREGAELVIVFGASAIADRRDVIPAAVEAIGGRVEHFGMPVDPGNLLLLAEARGRPLLGAPGCARSPKENGFDWVLMRLLAGLEVPREAITGLGVGGLLMEIVTRPQPRDEPVAATDHHIAAIVLAAGRSTRMGGPNKLLAEISGKPLVRIAAEQALASQGVAGDRRHRPRARARRRRARRACRSRSCTIRILRQASAAR